MKKSEKKVSKKIRFRKSTRSEFRWETEKLTRLQTKMTLFLDAEKFAINANGYLWI